MSIEQALCPELESGQIVIRDNPVLHKSEKIKSELS
jgi:hypothetical protein